jgi:tryptophanyl-tRNA synthetase
MVTSRRPVVLSGSQPTGHLTIGNYIGAIRHWVRLQEEYDCLLLMVDLHALTVRNDPAVLRQRSYEFAALYVACGIDPNCATIFLQSHVPGHTQLAWVLSCVTPFGQLGRMTQFKDKAKKHADNVNAGLFTYPVLMAADILLYDTDLVPVGDDQRQHLELTRDVAGVFNRVHGEVLKVPEGYIPPIGARIMGLQNPAGKMSKTDLNPANYIALIDEPDTIRRKIRRAVTDPGSEVVVSADKPAISNLLAIFAGVTGASIEELEQRYVGRGYGQFKEDLAEAVIESLTEVQRRYRALSEDRSELEAMLVRGAESARRRSEVTLNRVYDALGLVRPGGKGLSWSASSSCTDDGSGCRQRHEAR